MKPSAPAPKNEDAHLDEVERALSALDGRHPEYVRAQREAREAAAARATAREQERRAASQQRVRRLAVRAAAVVVVAAGAATAVAIGLRVHALAAGEDAASARFEAAGFSTVASSSIVAPRALGADGTAGRCFVAVAASEGAMTVRHGATELRGTRAVGWCACAAERVEVRAPEGAAGSEGVRLLDQDARTIGGPEGWAEMEPGARPDVVGGAGEACAEQALVAWIAARRFKPLPIDARWLDEGPGAPLVRVGFRAVAGAPVRRRFAVVDALAEACFFATRGEGAGSGQLLLDDIDGAELARGPSLLFCSAKGEPLVVRSDGTANVVVVAAPAARIGGRLGAREELERAGVRDFALWLRPSDLAWDAASALRASALRDAAPVASGEPPPSAARFLAVSLGVEGGLSKDPGADASAAACAPAIAPGAAAVCALSGPSPWRAARGEPSPLAWAPLPFWMTALEGARAPGAARAEVALAALARRLVARGFEATTLEGVKELEPGRVQVIGRGGDDALVAVEVAASAPWVFPYAAPGDPPWTLADEPRFVAVAPGASATLVATTKPAGKATERRTVVFRGRAGR